MIEINKNKGFQKFNGDHGIHSNVFEKEGHVYKISNYNSLNRALDDYKKYQNLCKNFPDKLQPSEIFMCLHEGKEKVCVKQKIINGKPLKDINKKELKNFLQKNSNDLLFLKTLIRTGINNIQTKKLYPDPIGNPSDQSLFNAINLFLDNVKGLVLCDIGFAPHEETLKINGIEFFNSENVSHYHEKMKEALEWIESI